MNINVVIWYLHIHYLKGTNVYYIVTDNPIRVF